VTGPPKSSRSRRTIPLPEITVTTLRRHREAQSVELLKAGARGTESTPVFTSTVGSTLEPRNVSRLFDELQAKAGVRRIRLHDLRHTCASMLSQGVPPRVVMDVLGHSQLSITMDIYGHVMASALRDAADGMGRALSEGDCVAVNAAVKSPEVPRIEACSILCTPSDLHFRWRARQDSNLQPSDP